MKISKEKQLFTISGYVFLLSISLLCILPFLLILSGSFSQEEDIVRHGYSLWPRDWSLAAYKLVLDNPGEILNAAFISISLVIVGTTLGVFLTAMTAYPLQRKDLKYRNTISFYIYFTSIFSGGIVPFYIIMVNYLHMKNNYLALLIPLLLNVFYILVMKSFFASIPNELVESGKIDGAGEFYIFIKLILPIAKPSLATIGLFISLSYWNDFYNAALFISDQRLVPLQYYLYNILNKQDSLRNMATTTGIPLLNMPKETFKLAVTILIILPILFVYPFAQRFIVKGVTLGSVKG